MPSDDINDTPAQAQAAEAIALASTTHTAIEAADTQATSGIWCGSAGLARQEEGGCHGW